MPLQDATPEVLNTLLPCSDESTQTQLPRFFKGRQLSKIICTSPPTRKSSDKLRASQKHEKKGELPGCPRDPFGKMKKRKNFAKNNILISIRPICIPVYQHIIFLEAVEFPQSSASIITQKCMDSWEICKEAKRDSFNCIRWQLYVAAFRFTGRPICS